MRASAAGCRVENLTGAERNPGEKRRDSAAIARAVESVNGW